MLWRSVLAVLSVCAAAATGQSCSGTASPDAPYWMESIKHQGVAPFNGDSSYKVFRNVKDFGAKGDGVTDDTAAINEAISSGNARCGNGNCPSSTISPALVYFPAGKYVVSSALNAFYYTQLIGDAKNPPTLVASSYFAGTAVIDADPYAPTGWYTNQNNFFRSVRNFVIDLTGAPAAGATGLHWQVSQGTSLTNIRIEMGKGSNHQGMFMENGSGGFMGDLVVNGGKYGLWMGNQQFTVRNVTINDAATAIWLQWNWGWTFQGITISRAQVGFDLVSGGLDKDHQTVGGVALIDGVINDTPIGIRSSTNSQGSLHGSLVLNNLKLNNVPSAVAVADGTVVLAGGSSTVSSWGQGNVFTGTGTQGEFVQGEIAGAKKDDSLLDSAGRIFGRGHPQYADFDASQVLSARDAGAKGDGVTDDTAALQSLFDAAQGCKVAFLDAGVYYVTDTVTIPVGSRVVGEAWSVIIGGGSAFADEANPKVVVKIGQTGDKGTAEITDVIFATKAPTPGAIVVEWNVAGDSQGSSGMWDSHVRLGGAKGTETSLAQCPSGSLDFSSCSVASLALHLTSSSSVYLEGTWVWTADHDMEDPSQNRTTLFSARGILSESAGPVWMVGTGSEHHVMYQYSLVGAKNHYMGLIQTETPYYQPAPEPPAPFQASSAFSDPDMTGLKAAWGLSVKSSSDIFVFGAGLYSFFQNYGQDCLDTNSCQEQIVNIDDDSSVAIYQLATLGVTSSLSINGKAIIPASANIDGIQQTTTLWTRK